jgi:hypothetical protein
MELLNLFLNDYPNVFIWRMCDGINKTFTKSPPSKGTNVCPSNKGHLTFKIMVLRLCCRYLMMSSNDTISKNVWILPNKVSFAFAFAF